MRVDFDGRRTRGVDLVERLLNDGERFDGDLSPDDATDAIRALEGLDLPWLVQGMVEGGELFAAQVHAEMGRGLQEVVQNAQDQRARNIRFGWRLREGRGELLIAHDGNPVALPDVVFMAYAMHSGSRRDPDKIGRFGIGLKTLNQLGERLSVHCPPFNFEIAGGRIRHTAQPRPVRAFWNPQAGETLFVLRLVDGLDLGFFRDWFSEWDAESLVFLRNLRRLSLVDLTKNKQLLDYHLAEERARTVQLDIAGGADAERLVLRDEKSGRTWTRYSVSYPTPKRLRELKQTDKPFGDTVQLALAIPSRGERTGRLYAGLPLAETCELKMSLHAPFFVNVDRTALREDRHGANQWLLDRLGELVAAVALQRFAERPGSGWRAVPLSEETVGAPRSWLSVHSESSLDRARARINARLRLKLDGNEARLEDLVFEHEALDGLLTEADQEAHEPGKQALPARFRDAGRWREVLRDLDGSAEISVLDALGMLDWDDPDPAARGARWLVRLAAAALGAGYEWALPPKRWLLLRDGSRMSPDEIKHDGLLLVQSPGSGLGAELGVEIGIAPAYLASTPEARAVRTSLHESGVLKTRSSDTDAVRALAAGNGERPVNLADRNELLLRIRGVLLPGDERDELARGVGRNILLAGREYDAKGRPAEVAVRPSQAYLPSAIDKSEGWSTAAARTPGVRWVDPKYADTLKSARGSRGQGALGFLRRLGAQVAPRLEAPETEFDRTALPPQQRDELRGVGTVETLFEDAVSPDLDLVLANIVREKKATVRRRRARALFIALNRAWPDLYAEHGSATPGYFYRSWRQRAPITSTWLARLASTPWLTTQEKGLHPAAPRDLRILTGANGLAGEDPSIYADELDDEHANTPLAEALGIKGRPPASELLDLLEEFRATSVAGGHTDPRRAQRCYEALARYCPGGPDADRVDVTERAIKAAFGYSTSKTGLILHNHEWLPPARVRRSSYLTADVPVVTGAPELWDLLGVRETDAKDCVDALTALAGRGEEERPAQIRIYRRLLELLDRERKLELTLGAAPFFTAAGWVIGTRVYAVANTALAEALSTKVAVWRPPLALEELRPLLPKLPVEHVDEMQALPDVTPDALVAGATVGRELPNAAEHLKNTIFVFNPALFERIPRAAWEKLARAHVALGTGWNLKIRLPGQRRQIRVTPPAYFFIDAGLLCALDEDEAGEMRAGGQAVASLFSEADLDEADRAFIAMGWESAFRHRQDEQESLDESKPEVETGDPDGELPVPERSKRLRRRRTRERAGKKPQEPAAGPPAERALIDPATVDLAALPVTILEPKQGGRLRSRARRPLKEPDGRDGRDGRAPGKRPAGRPQNAKERERVGFELMEDYLFAAYGLKLKNYCDRQDIGADGVDDEQDVWVELKAHAGDAPDSVKLTASEAERAHEKGDRYWLVVASGLEQGHTPALVIVQNPLRRLDAYIGGGIRLVVKA